jgi:hypothetical protein
MHYLGQDMKALGNIVLGIEDSLEQTLLNPNMEMATAI